jgi:3-oxoacyl-[acyl-carrier protein] reductase
MMTVLITGGSRGIGADLVCRFARDGYTVAFVYHNAHEAAASVARETGAFAICADISMPDEARRAVAEAKEKLGHIDVLINNAAVAGFRLFTDITDEEWNRFIGVNLSGAFYLSRAVLPDMISRKSGSIINISSMWGQVGASCEVHYSAAKAGLIGLTKALAKELGPSGIRVNCIAPGVIDTEMNAALQEEDRRALIEETPLMRLGTPADVAAAALFLAGEGASFITGQVLGVNGGFVI